MDEKKRKAALRMLSYGVYIITSKNDNDICASTVTWVSQMSFEPPLISVCIKKKSATYSMMLRQIIAPVKVSIRSFKF